jgi:NAD(P)H dehydrogenase (quinone)
MTIAVTGGSGEFGRATLQALGRRTREPLVATVRDLERVDPLPEVDYRPGDFDQPDTLRASLAGADTVLVNATFFGADPSLRLPRVAAAIRAAADAGVGRIVLTSWPDLGLATLPAVQDYKQLETLLEAAGPAWTIVRLGYGLPVALARDVVWGKIGGELVAPAAGGRVTPAAPADLAEAIATVLAVPGHEGEGVVYELSGPEVVSWDQLAELAGVPFRPVGDEDYRDYLTRFALPAGTDQALIEMYADFRGDWAAAPTGTLARLIGRAPMRGIEAVREAVGRFPAG